MRRLGLLLACLAVAIAADTSSAAYEPPTKRPSLQPGNLIFVPQDEGRCTLGFLLRDTSGVVYGLSWGNCPPDAAGTPAAVGVNTAYYGDRSWPAGRGPLVEGYTPKVRPIGRFVLAVSRPDNDALQYSLFRLNRGVAYRGDVAVVGGPAPVPYGHMTTLPGPVDVIAHDSYAVDGPTGPQGYDDGVRTLIAEALRPTSFRVAGAATVDQGGAPVVLTGQDGGPVAVGLLSGRVGTGATEGNEDGRGAGAVVYRLDSIIADASSRVGRRLTLVSAGQSGRAQK